jgi:hypothetical protein
MVLELLTISLAADWITRLGKKLVAIQKARATEVRDLADVFGRPWDLAPYYVEPHCQATNPTTQEDDELEPGIRELLTSYLSTWLSGAATVGGSSRNTIFLLGDAGMGKTSALVMFKLLHLGQFLPDSLARIHHHENARN